MNRLPRKLNENLWNKKGNFEKEGYCYELQKACEEN